MKDWEKLSPIPVSKLKPYFLTYRRSLSYWFVKEYLLGQSVINYFIYKCNQLFLYFLILQLRDEISNSWYIISFHNYCILLLAYFKQQWIFISEAWILLKSFVGWYPILRTIQCSKNCRDFIKYHLQNNVRMLQRDWLLRLWKEILNYKRLKVTVCKQ